MWNNRDRAPASIFVAALLALLATIGDGHAQSGFTAFESGPVRPLAMSSDGTRLYAANTPDNRLEILAVVDGVLSSVGSVAVGLEPVAVAMNGDGEVWVVNHLSDSISIVDVAASPPRVARTLWVGDEPRDIVFAGPGRNRAFITTAHRGQSVPYDPQFTTPGVGRADVWVFNAQAPGAAAGGTPIGIVTLFGDTPRGLTVSPDGDTVYAAIFHSGNRTTVLNEEIVCNGGEDAVCFVDGMRMPGGLPGPLKNAAGDDRPEVGLIVKFDEDTGDWLDDHGRDWSAAVRFDLPDYDVFAIDASASPPVEADRFASVGTILFNMATNPVTGRVYVTNTEARNEVRFEGPGTTGGTTVRSRLHQARISVIDPVAASVEAHHLNPHIDYATVPSPAGVADRSLATPLEMAITEDGSTLYVAAFGSAAIGIIDTAELEAGTRTPDVADRIELSGGGPGGLVLDEDSDRLYVFTRFDNTVTAIDLSSRTEVQRLPLHNPEPRAIVAGRPMLYDARFGSSNGEASCSSCHVFGDVDDLAWDLGDPDGEVVRVRSTTFHPMKGPMTVQTLRGLTGHGPLHWRGERNGAVEPGGNHLDVRAAFSQFNSTFVNLLGRASEIDDTEMAVFTDFVLRLMPPPNPVFALDNSLTPQQERGRDLYFGTPITCSACHTLAPEQDLFGTNATQSISLETQEFKTPQLRSMYQRVGMFGVAPIPMFGGAGNTSHQGDQIRGFGYIHDGSVDTLFRFVSANIFNLPEHDRRDLEAFMLAFPSNLASVVGQQVTLSAGSTAAATARLDTLVARAAAGVCDLTAHGVRNGEDRGWLYLPAAGGSFTSDRAAEANVSRVALLAGATTGPLTFTCVPPGSGRRIGIDRDGDGLRDRDELDAGSDPADADSPTFTCTGDCDRDGRVSIAELVRGVAIALGNAEASTCLALDTDLDDQVSIADLIAAVNNALAPCQ